MLVCGSFFTSCGDGPASLLAIVPDSLGAPWILAVSLSSPAPVLRSMCGSPQDVTSVYLSSLPGIGDPKQISVPFSRGTGVEGLIFVLPLMYTPFTLCNGGAVYQNIENVPIDNCGNCLFRFDRSNATHNEQKITTISPFFKHHI